MKITLIVGRLSMTHFRILSIRTAIVIARKLFVGLAFVLTRNSNRSTLNQTFDKMRPTNGDCYWSPKNFTKQEVIPYAEAD